MKARNEFETATNKVEASLVVEELSDADLMGINGGLLDNANLQYALQYALQNVAQKGIYVLGDKNA